MRETFGLPLVKTDPVSKADWLALFIEAAQILPERGLDFEDPYGFRKEAMDLREQGWRLACLGWRESKAIFLHRYNEVAYV
jgi:hypothetical protein